MRPTRLHVFHRQEDAPPAALRGAHVVVIDVLRASSTVTAALAAGAREAWWLRTVRDVFLARRQLSARALLLCGERGGKRVRGFDLGNSPRAFTHERCAGCTLLMSTTNGTRAMALARDARRILIGCFLNLGALAGALARTRGEIVLLCAGTEGYVSADDMACAGAIAERIEGAALSPQAQEAVRTWQRARRAIRKFLLASEGGVPLVRIGLGQDVIDCSRRDRFPLAPRVIERSHGYRIIAR